jgi:excisionase family DNA binding protein
VMLMTPCRTATSQAVAAALGLSAATIARHAREGRVPFSTTPGGHRRFSLAEVHSALDADARINLTPIVTSGLINVSGGVAPGRSDAAARAVVVKAVYSGSLRSRSRPVGPVARGRPIARWP